MRIAQTPAKRHAANAEKVKEEWRERKFFQHALNRVSRRSVVKPSFARPALSRFEKRQVEQAVSASGEGSSKPPGVVATGRGRQRREYSAEPAPCCQR